MHICVHRYPDILLHEAQYNDNISKGMIIVLLSILADKAKASQKNGERYQDLLRKEMIVWKSELVFDANQQISVTHCSVKIGKEIFYESL